MKRVSLFILILFTTAFVISCKKGDPGPQGPTGPVGPTGATGATGTANVIYSDWFSFLATDWGDTAITNIGNAKRAIKIAQGVTQNILDHGLVMAYLKVDDNGGGPYQLPFIYNKNPAGAYEMIPRVGSIIFYNYYFDNSGGQIPNPAQKLRYIIIPGGVSGGRTINYAGLSYEELCNTLNIPR